MSDRLRDVHDLLLSPGTAQREYLRVLDELEARTAQLAAVVKLLVRDLPDNFGPDDKYIAYGASLEARCFATAEEATDYVMREAGIAQEARP